MHEPFLAYRIREQHGQTHASLEHVRLAELSRGGVIIEARYSSVNYSPGRNRQRQGPAPLTVDRGDRRGGAGRELR